MKRMLTVWLTMAAVALGALPAAAGTTRDYHVGAEKDYSSLANVFAAIEELEDKKDDDVFNIHIYGIVRLSGKYNDYYGLRFYGETTDATLAGPSDTSDDGFQIRSEYKANNNTELHDLIIKDNDVGGWDHVFCNVQLVKNCKFQSVKSDGSILDNEGNSIDLTITNTTFSSCTVNGGLVYNCGKYESSEKRTLSVKNCSFDSCKTGHGVFQDCKSIEVLSSTFKQCTTTDHGSVFYNCEYVVVEDSTFDTCTAENDGGVDCHAKETHRFRRCRFLSCEASGKGGVFWLEDDEKLGVFDSVFYNCKSGGRGGVVDGADGSKDETVFAIWNCTFYGCSSGSGELLLYQINCYNSLFYGSPFLISDGYKSSNNVEYDSSEVASSAVFEDTTNFELVRSATTTASGNGVIDKGCDRTHLSETTDLNGKARKFGSAVDIGCTEWTSSGDVVVTSSENSGIGTLRDAIDQINLVGKGKITFASDVTTVTLTSALPTLTATENVTIDGGSGIQINCTNFTGRALTMQGNGAYSLTGLHFNGGGKASAILNNSTTSLTVRDCSFVNLVDGQLGGAGIQLGIGDLTVENCRFDDCKATSQFCGGGIYCSGECVGSVSISKCSFVGCYAVNGASISFTSYGGGGIEIQNCSFLENTGTSDILLWSSTLPTVSIVAQCTFANNTTYIVQHAGVSSGNLCFASCLFANRTQFAAAESPASINVQRSLFSECVPEGCTYSTDTSFTGDGCYIVPTNEQPYVLGEKIESTVSGVTQTSYKFGRYSPAMEFPGWFIWRNGWSGVGYQRARVSELGRGVFFGSDDDTFYNVTDQFGQTENDFDLIPITCNVQSSEAPPVGAIWNTPDDYEQPAWLTLNDVYNQTNHYIMCPIGSVTNAPTPTRPRATFNGWWTTAHSKDGGEQWFDAQGRQLKLNSGRTTLYARWIGDDHLRFINSFSSKVTLVGVIKGDPLPTVADGVPVPTYAGCKFLGWYDGGYFGQGTQWYDANGNAVLDPDEYPADGDTYLFSAWDMSGMDIRLDPPIVVTGETNIDHRTYAQHATNELFRVESGGTLRLNSVTITGDTWCVFLRKSAILNNGGTVVCSNCNFTSLLVPTNSGAAYSGTGGSARFINCSFTENSARNGGAVQSSGGTLCFLNCTFTGNKTLLGGTENPGGAAIATTGDVNLQLGACTVTDNSAPSTNYGAGVWLDNAAGAYVRLYSTIIQGNGAKNEMTVSVSGGKWTSRVHGSYIGDRYVGEDCTRTFSLTYPSAAVTMLGSLRTMVCDGVTQTYFPPLNEARKKGLKVWFNGEQIDWGGNNPGAGWSGVTWDILGEQTASGKSISLRDSYIGSRRRNVLQDLIDATPTSGEWYSDMTLSVPADTYDPVDITRPIRIVGEKGAEIEAAYLQPCVTISNSPSPVVVGGMTLSNGGGAQGGGVNVTAGGELVAVSNCTLSACVATDAGGGVYDAGETIYVVACKFKNCSAKNGGGVCQVKSIQDCTFTGCVAVEKGGGAYDVGTVADSTFTGCSAADGGGAHTVDAVNTCTFASNAATNNGGGVCSSPVVSSSTFSGNVAKDFGGGAYDVDKLQLCTLTDNVATNYGGGAAKIGTAGGCTLKENVALLGGGGLYDAFARESVFESNVVGPAPDDDIVPAGGGAGATDAMGCIFRENYSYGTGGGIETGSGNARGCLFTDNVAVDEGGAVAGDAYNCTFVRNYGDSSRNLSTSVLNADGRCYDSLFYNNALPDHADSASMTAKSTYFYNAGSNNFHLRDTAEVIENLTGSVSGRTRAREGGWIDPENSDLVNTEGGITYYYLGCYAFLPAAVAGVKVNGTDDTYEDTNLKTSLREAIENAQDDPEAYKGADGKIHIVFDENKLFRDGKLTNVVLDIGKSGVALTNFTKYPLVVEAPADRGITITGNDLYRPFYVLPGNRLELKNLTISDATGGPFTMGKYTTGTDGGAVMNQGTLVASNCVFRNCSGGLKTSIVYGASVGNGGAIYAMEGSTTMVANCTFDGCRAARGGAVFGAVNSFSTYLATTFTGNRAANGAAVMSGTGGAAYLDTGSSAAFVHCTLANNVADTSGAGVYAIGSLYFLNSLIVGNRCGEEANDIVASGPVKMVRSWYGAFPDAASHLTATESEGDVSPADVFAKTTADGWAVATTQAVVTVDRQHTYYALRNDAATDGYYAWSDTLGVNIGWNKTGNSSPSTVLRGSLQGARRGGRLVTDQLGKSAGSDALLLGAVKETAKPSTDLPAADDDPLCVTDANTLEKAFAYASSATPKDGFVTITFAVSAVPLTKQLTLENFTAANGKTLRIVGGDDVKITGVNNQRVFNVTAGNRLEITNLTITASHYGSGGAIRVENGSLVADGVAFVNCQTLSVGGDNNGDYSDGGAVALIGDNASATFSDCTFTKCVANDGFGQAVYRETEDIRFYRCTLEDEDDIYTAMRIRVEHPDGTTDLFPETLPALKSPLMSGDTVVILDENAQATSDLNVTIPPGVTVRDDTLLGAPLVLAAAKAAMAASVATKSWYSVVETPTSVSVQLNEEAIPTLTGDGAEIDLDGASDEVAVTPANVKPGLWYGLGQSETPEGPYTVETWVQADADGNLPAALTAPKDGSSGFYRVMVK